MTVDLIAHLKHFEGLRLEAYQDQNGYWTIGYGHAETSGIDPIPYKGMRITLAEAEAILINDIQVAQGAIRRMVKVPLNENELAGLTGLVFNIGAGQFKTSTALRRLNAGDREGAANAMLWWNKITENGVKVVSNGLVRRRADEVAAFMLPVDGEIQHAGGQVSGGEGRSPSKSTTIWGAISAIGSAALAKVTGFLENVDDTTLIIIVGMCLVFAYLALNRWLEYGRGEYR